MSVKRREISLTPGQVGELMPPIMEVVLGLTPDRVQYWIGKKSKLVLEIRKVLLGESKIEKVSYEDPLLEQARFYLEVFDRELDVSLLKPPAESEGFNWILHMAEGLTPMQIWAVLEKRMPAFTYWDNLDEIVSDRDPRNGAYTIRLRDRVEADEELKNKSAEDLKKEGIHGITLPERFILELFHNWRTGGHLDLENVTLCSGSRGLGGFVPRVYWSGDRLCVDWDDAGGRDGYLRTRAVVS